MMDIAFFETNERTEFSDELYGVIGRALTIATHFEQNCKAVANTIEIRQNTNLMQNPEDFLEFVEKLSKKTLCWGIMKFSSTIKEGLQEKGMSEDVIEACNGALFQPLEQGRKARNFIAHELASGVAGKSENEDFRKQTIDMVKDNVSIIAKADFYIAGFIENHINKNCVSPNEERYVQQMIDWVCKTYS